MAWLSRVNANKYLPKGSKLIEATILSSLTDFN